MDDILLLCLESVFGSECALSISQWTLGISSVQRYCDSQSALGLYVSYKSYLRARLVQWAIQCFRLRHTARIDRIYQLHNQYYKANIKAQALLAYLDYTHLRQIDQHADFQLKDIHSVKMTATLIWREIILSHTHVSALLEDATYAGEMWRTEFLKGIKRGNQPNISEQQRYLIKSILKCVKIIKGHDNNDKDDNIKQFEEVQLKLVNKCYSDTWDSHTFIHNGNNIICSIIPKIIDTECLIWEKCFGSYRIEILRKNLSEILLGKFSQELCLFLSNSLRENTKPIGAFILERLKLVKEGKLILSKVLESFVAEVGNSLHSILIPYADSLSRFSGMFDVVLWICIQFKCYEHLNVWFDSKEEPFWRTAISNQLQLRITTAELEARDKTDLVSFPAAISVCIDGILGTKYSPASICKEVLEKIIKFDEKDTVKLLIQSLSVLRLISDKDRFESCYLDLLADRMIKSTSNIEFEKVIVEEFSKCDLSTSFIYYSHSMINDKTNQPLLEKNLIAFMKEKRMRKPFPQMKILVGASERWPLKKITSDSLRDTEIWGMQCIKFNRDTEIQSQMDLVNSFYSQFYPGRNLFWDHLNSMVLIASTHLSKPYEFIVNGLQVAVLIQFNHEMTELSYSSLVSSLDIPEKVLHLVLLSLTRSKLLISSLSMEFFKESIYSLNYDFKSYVFNFIHSFKLIYCT